MKSEKLEVVRGSGSVFRDVGHQNADVEQLKAIMAAEIIKVLDRDGLSVRAAHDRTGFAAADFSRVRKCGSRTLYSRSANVDSQPGSGRALRRKSGYVAFNASSSRVAW
jgi:hypothetical protein